MAKSKKQQEGIKPIKKEKFSKTLSTPKPSRPEKKDISKAKDNKK